jgi:hypothetical protein
MIMPPRMEPSILFRFALRSIGAWLGSIVFAGSVAQATAVTNLMNIQFGVNDSTRKVGPAAYGVSELDVWNLYSRDDGQGGFRISGSVPNLLWADGSPSSAILQVDNAPGAWANDNPDPMFGLYLYPFNGNPITLTLSSLPAGTYDIYAYGHGGPPDVQNTLFEVHSGGIHFGAKRTSTRVGWNTTNWQENIQFVRFESVSVFPGHPLTVLSKPDAIPQAVVNGLQIVRRNDTPVGTPVDPPVDPPITNPPPIVTNQPPVIVGQSNGLLNVQFGTDNSAVKVGPAAIGQGGEDFWNRYSRDGTGGGFKQSGSIETLYWANGEPSGASLTIGNAAGAWANGNPDPMFGVFLYPLSGNPVVTVTITNLPGGIYSLYAFGRGGPPDDHNTVFELLSAGESLGDKATTSSPGWNTTQWTEGKQFVVYTNVMVEADSPLVLLAKPGAHSFGMINGLQLRREGPLRVRVSPDGGFFTNAVMVRILGGGLNRTIRYTLDGSDPSTNSLLYRRPFELSAAAMVKAQAFAEDLAVGESVFATFQRVYALNDGIKAEWRRLHFGDGFRTDPRAAADADPDGDGASNLQEFIADSNPTDALSGFLVKTRLVPSISWRSEPGKTYRILRKPNLAHPDWIFVKEITATTPFSRFTDEDVENTDSFYTVEPVH